MKLGSHNTMTYLKPKKWYLYPFQFIARCQSKNIEKQYMLGARWFDLRIAFDKKGRPEFRHGLMSYKGDVFKVLSFLNNQNDVVVRILLEKDHPFFKDFCQHIEEQYPNISFTGGQRKSDWTQVYAFKNSPCYSIEENYSSMPTNSKWKGLWPWLYAKLNNKKEPKTDRDYLLLDFIQYA